MIKHKILWLVPLIIIVGGSLAAAGYFYKKYEKIKKNPNFVNQEEGVTLANKIGRFMMLPTDENPSIATVVDADKLKDQPFFKNTIKDDKILIYSKAQKAILYRPSTNKIIEIAPLSLGEPQSSATPSPTITAATNVVLLNGSKTAGLTNTAESKIKDIAGVNILSKGNAVKTDYTKNLVIDLTGKNQAMAEQLAQAIDGEVSNQIDGEQKPAGADILIIVSK